MKNTTVLIDGDSLLYYEMGKPTLEIAIQGLDDRIQTMLDRAETNKYAGFLTIGKCFRYERATTKKYKGNRKHGDKPIIFNALKAYLQQHWKFIYVPELEADDLVAIYGEGLDGNTMICSPDKDVLYQVAGNHFNYNTGEMIHTTETEALLFLWKQTLMGDSTDGIPGIPKLGPKTAEKLMNNVQLFDMPAMVLNKYIEMFGNQEGIHRFAETFKLVYILKTKTEALLEAGVTLPELVVHEVQVKTDELW
jgi:hypothetical protein|tara:strand:- start:334 stop:1083 length:750 start_codon:yes stop_codon:yes gene_type:complete